MFADGFQTVFILFSFGFHMGIVWPFYGFHMFLMQFSEMFVYSLRPVKRHSGPRPSFLYSEYQEEVQVLGLRTQALDNIDDVFKLLFICVDGDLKLAPVWSTGFACECNAGLVFMVITTAERCK